MRWWYVFSIALFILPFTSADSSQSFAEERVILTRLFFQDDDAKTLRWADLYAGTPPSLGKVHDIAGFPKLAAEGQSLVQMGAARGMILVGVRDAEDGKKQSGWVLIDSGVGNEEHGDHGHSTYEKPP